MKNIHNLSSSFTNNKSLHEKSELDTTSSLKVSEEDNNSATNSSKSTYKYRAKIRKRSNDICYTLSFYERYGNIYISHNLSQIFIAKIRKVNFDDNFQELFEKGKANLGNYFKEDVSTIPDITFWYQRYYYYKRFDEGILMDNESK
jgi:hypothetical protein